MPDTKFMDEQQTMAEFVHLRGWRGTPEGETRCVLPVKKCLNTEVERGLLSFLCYAGAFLSLGQRTKTKRQELVV